MKDGVVRHEFIQVKPKYVRAEERNKMIEQGKMSKLFTKDRRKQAKDDFKDRVEYNIQKKKHKKKELQKRFYNYDFKPSINKRRINLNPKKLHKNVYTKKATKKVLPVLERSLDDSFGKDKNVQNELLDKEDNESHKESIHDNIKGLQKNLEKMEQERKQEKEHEMAWKEANFSRKGKYAVKGRIETKGSSCKIQYK